MWACCKQINAIDKLDQSFSDGLENCYFVRNFLRRESEKEGGWEREIKRERERVREKENKEIFISW